MSWGGGTPVKALLRREEGAGRTYPDGIHDVHDPDEEDEETQVGCVLDDVEDDHEAEREQDLVPLRENVSLLSPQRGQGGTGRTLQRVNQSLRAQNIIKHMMTRTGMHLRNKKNP